MLWSEVNLALKLLEKMDKQNGEDKVMVLVSTTILTISLLASVAFGSFCANRQYFNAKLQACLNCTECTDGTIVMRPCEIHRDTYCASIGEVLQSLEGGNHHRHHHVQKKKKHPKPSERVTSRYEEENVNKHQDIEEPNALEVASSEVPFSSAETLVWDWQAIALTSAVFTCILFFLVITLYSLHQAKQWRRLKENFEADVEELSARLSLMAAAAAAEKGESQKEADIVGDTSYLNLEGRCVYLEQLLNERKCGEKVTILPKGNLYIEENNSKT